MAARGRSGTPGSAGVPPALGGLGFNKAAAMANRPARRGKRRARRPRSQGFRCASIINVVGVAGRHPLLTAAGISSWYLPLLLQLMLVLSAAARQAHIRELLAAARCRKSHRSRSVGTLGASYLSPAGSAFCLRRQPPDATCILMNPYVARANLPVRSASPGLVEPELGITGCSWRKAI